MGNGSDGLFGKQPLSTTSALTIVGESQSSWRTTPVICSFIRLADILVPQLKLAIYVMRSFTNLPSTMSPLVLAAVLASAVGVVAMSIRAFESEGAKAKRLELKRQKELRSLTGRISAYARAVRQQFPSGDVVVSERDLAEQLRKRTDLVVTALNLLLNEQKVQKAPLSGYWKLNA